MNNKTIEFGRYYQNGIEKEPIKWIIFSEKEDSCFLICEKCVDAVPFYSTGINDDAITDWEKSTLRTWLNEEFFNQAFNEAEKELIVEKTLYSICEAVPSGENKKSISKVITTDKVFVLSQAECEFYIKDPKIMVALNNDLAKEKTKKEYAEWWLRDIGYFGSDARYVDCTGKIHDSCKEGNYTVDVRSPFISVRPVIVMKKF